nr:DUF1266 domain-containing protein [uncultured Bacteroides sp.]
MKTKKTSLFNANPQPGVVDSNRQHALLIGLIAGEQKQFYTNSLTTGANQELLGSLLSEKTKMKDTLQIQLIFDFLKEEGERGAYDIMIPLFLSNNDEKKRETAIQERFVGIERFAQYCRNLNNFLQYIQSHSTLCITYEDLQRGILAWDLGKMIILARIASDYGLISEKEAWEYIEFADKKCRESFTSWEEVGKSYLLGQAVNHPGEEEFKKVIGYYCSAMEDAESPWINMPF